MKTTEKELKEFGRLICKISAGYEMSRAEALEAYRQIILNIQPELQQGAFMMAHISRGPTKEELAGAWEALDLYDTTKISAKNANAVCDIVGTGSDPLKTVNCSTPAALIAAACGLPMAKKGARLVTGASGASDIMEIFGIDLDATLSKAEESLRKNGICYLPGEAFLKSGWARLIRSMRFTSVFNIIGPLTMPCEETDSIVIGAFSRNVCAQLIDTLHGINMKTALSPFGLADGMDNETGMDEFSPCGTTEVVELKNSKIDKYELRPDDFGIKAFDYKKIASSDTAQGNAKRIMDVLKFKYDSPEADFFCMNAAAALHISNFALTYSKGFEMAKQALSSGKAFEKLEQLRESQGK
jgi:anthranilate phosphoribosyltransferase